MKPETIYTEEWIEANADIVDWRDICWHAPIFEFSDLFFEKFGCELNWQYLSYCKSINETFIIKHKKYIVWHYVSYRMDLKKFSDDFFEKFSNELNWNSILANISGTINNNNKFSYEFLRKFQDKIDWYYLYHCFPLSKRFLFEFQDKIPQATIEEYTEKWIETNLDEVDWENICSYANVYSFSDEFFDKFDSEIDWNHIFFNIMIDDIFSDRNYCYKFVRKWQHKFNWELISNEYPLPMTFIRRFHNQIDWDMISERGTLSESLMRKFGNKIVWSSIDLLDGKVLSDDFITEFKEKLPKRYSELQEKLHKI